MVILLEELKRVFQNQGFSESGMYNLDLLDCELKEASNKEIQANNLDTWFDLDEYDFQIKCHNYCYDTEYDGIQLSFECSIILDNYEENGISYLNTLYDIVHLTYADGTEKVLTF